MKELVHFLASGSLSQSQQRREEDSRGDECESSSRVLSFENPTLVPASSARRRAQGLVHLHQKQGAPLD